MAGSSVAPAVSDGSSVAQAVSDGKAGTQPLVEFTRRVMTKLKEVMMGNDDGGSDIQRSTAPSATAAGAKPSVVSADTKLPSVGSADTKLPSVGSASADTKLPSVWSADTKPPSVGSADTKPEVVRVMSEPKFRAHLPRLSGHILLVPLGGGADPLTALAVAQHLVKRDGITFTIVLPIYERLAKLIPAGRVSAEVRNGSYRLVRLGGAPAPLMPEFDQAKDPIGIELSVDAPAVYLLTIPNKDEPHKDAEAMPRVAALLSSLADAKTRFLIGVDGGGDGLLGQPGRDRRVIDMIGLLADQRRAAGLPPVFPLGVAVAPGCDGESTQADMDAALLGLAATDRFAGVCPIPEASLLRLGELAKPWLDGEANANRTPCIILRASKKPPTEDYHIRRKTGPTTFREQIVLVDRLQHMVLFMIGADGSLDAYLADKFLHSMLTPHLAVKYKDMIGADRQLTPLAMNGARPANMARLLEAIAFGAFDPPYSVRAITQLGGQLPCDVRALSKRAKPTSEPEKLPSDKASMKSGGPGQAAAPGTTQSSPVLAHSGAAATQNAPHVTAQNKSGDGPLIANQAGSPLGTPAAQGGGAGGVIPAQPKSAGDATDLKGVISAAGDEADEAVFLLILGNRADNEANWNSNKEEHTGTASIAPHHPGQLARHIFAVPTPALARQFPLFALNASVFESGHLDVLNKMEVAVRSYVERSYGADSEYMLFFHAAEDASQWFTHLHIVVTKPGTLPAAPSQTAHKAAGSEGPPPFLQTSRLVPPSKPPVAITAHTAHTAGSSAHSAQPPARTVGGEIKVAAQVVDLEDDVPEIVESFEPIRRNPVRGKATPHEADPSLSKAAEPSLQKGARGQVNPALSQTPPMGGEAARTGPGSSALWRGEVGHSFYELMARNIPLAVVQRTLAARATLAPTSTVQAQALSMPAMPHAATSAHS
jgi:hypothetical protein